MLYILEYTVLHVLQETLTHTQELSPMYSKIVILLHELYAKYTQHYLYLYAKKSVWILDSVVKYCT